MSAFARSSNPVAIPPSVSDSPTDGQATAPGDSAAAPLPGQALDQSVSLELEWLRDCGPLDVACLQLEPILLMQKRNHVTRSFNTYPVQVPGIQQGTEHWLRQPMRGNGRDPFRRA